MKAKNLKFYVGIFLIPIVIMIILSKISMESGQEYLDGTIVDIVNIKLIVEIDNQYDEVISQVG